MDNIRFILVVAFAMICYMMWEAWQIDYGPKPQLPNIAKSINKGEELPLNGAAQVNNSSDPVAATTDGKSKLVKVKTDVLSFEIDLEGGTVTNLDLLHYPVAKENTVVQKLYALIGLTKEPADTSPVRLFNSDEQKQFLAQSGLIAENGSAFVPDHHQPFKAAQTVYTLKAGEDTLSIPLTWENGEGLSVTKTLTLTRGSYTIQLSQKLGNQRNTPWSGRQYTQLLRTPYTNPAGNTFIRTYAGGVVYTEAEKYKKVTFDNMAKEELKLSSQGGWSAMIQHYFAAAWIPPAQQENNFYTKQLPGFRYVIGSYSPIATVAANSSLEFNSQLFVGPKVQPMMEKVSPGLELTVDYGWLTIVGKPIYWLLNQIHDFVDNWGLAILGVTFCIKLLFFKLSQASFQSMARMRKIQPQLKALQERYADDRQKFNQEMMAMYKREKVNPLGGCLPIMVQIPVFIALYWVLIETVELRQAPFLSWIQDLSAQDPFYLLPVLYGITMKIQQSLNPAPVDPIQAKMMQMFPIVFTVFFLFFPSGLVLYWICNNTLSILQQWYITKQIAESEK